MNSLNHIILGLQNRFTSVDLCYVLYCYRAASAALAAFIEVMQKIADVATGAKGGLLRSV